MGIISVLALELNITTIEHLLGFSTTWLPYNGLEPDTPVTEDITRGNRGRIHSCW